MGCLGNLGGVVIADLRGKCGHQHQRAAHQIGDVVAARLDADDAIVGEADGGIREQADRLQHRVADDGLVDVELEMALAAGNRGGGVVAHHLGAHHGQRLALGRVHLAGHDGGAGLVFRQCQFAEARARARAQETDVVGDLEQAHGHRVERAGQFHHGVMGAQGLELVGGGLERQLGQGRHFLGEFFRKARLGVEAGADRRAALGQLVDRGQGLLDAADAVLDGRDIAGEFLAQRQWRGVLGVGTADLDDVGPFLCLVIQRVAQLLQGGHQAVDGFLTGGNVHGGGEGVVGRLGAVHMVVRVHRLLGADGAAQHLDGAVGDHLIGVHVGLGAGARLPDDEREIVVELAFGHFQRRRRNGLAQLRLDVVECDIGQRGRPLDDTQRAHQRLGHGFRADLEVAERALGLGAPIFVGGDLQRAKAVGFGARTRHGGGFPSGLRWLKRPAV